MGETIYKICTKRQWQAALEAGVFSGSPDDLRDGFIHFSRAHQLAGTAAKYFAGQGDLMLVAVDSEVLGASLRLEASRGGDSFPHLYAPLSAADVLWTEELPWNGSSHVWPRDFDPGA